MSSGGSSARPSAAPARRECTAQARPLHARSFKLRFAPQREPGRSYVSLVKPFALPATVTDKFYTRPECEGDAGVEEGTALQRIQDMFTLGPRDKHVAPLTSAHVSVSNVYCNMFNITSAIHNQQSNNMCYRYGWWWDQISTLEQVPRSDRRLHHHIHDSQWLKECLRVLAADDKLKQK
ncbi:uncharacterized protein LOC115446860 isoform X2 [Manduca sexta]|uniref:uncharacterized protein LOC115446860 isoform X2 n=1 Tax=Manduca sexta TaxID=7130 RepID=UPI0011820232|nr:uncharacterized protein LOC115446860 isoform X2 [Manduca sexta]